MEAFADDTESDGIEAVGGPVRVREYDLFGISLLRQDHLMSSDILGRFEPKKGAASSRDVTTKPTHPSHTSCSGLPSSLKVPKVDLCPRPSW